MNVKVTYHAAIYNQLIIEIENLEQPIAVSFYNVNKIMNTPESCGSW